jgi:hypothetical protein
MTTERNESNSPGENAADYLPKITPVEFSKLVNALSKVSNGTSRDDLSYEEGVLVDIYAFLPGNRVELELDTRHRTGGVITGLPENFDRLGREVSRHWQIPVRLDSGAQGAYTIHALGIMETERGTRLSTRTRIIRNTTGNTQSPHI